MNTTSGKVRLATYEEVKKMMCNNAGGRLVKTMLVQLAGGESKSVTVGCKYDYVKIYSVGSIGVISNSGGGITYGNTVLVFNPSEKMMLLSENDVTVSIKNEIISFKSGDVHDYSGFTFHVEAYKYD